MEAVAARGRGELLAESLIGRVPDLLPRFRARSWTREERAKGQAWGLRRPETFHTYGTLVADPDVETKDVPVFEPSS